MICTICRRPALHLWTDESAYFCDVCWQWHQQKPGVLTPFQLPEYSLSTLDTIHHCDALALLRGLAAGSVDAVITDPPYGLGLDSWDTKIDFATLATEVYRVLKPDAFFAFFTQAPYDLEWRKATMETGFTYNDHVVWVKRVQTAIAQPIHRSHESFFIFKKGSPVYVVTKGNYTDVKLPGVLVDVISVEGVDRYIKNLRRELNTGEKGITPHSYKHQGVYSYMNIPADRSPEFVNFTNVWSFLPETRRQKSIDFDHPTLKPILFLQRAIELLSQPGALIVDPFSGSGTTAIAARNTGRHFICGDITREYVEQSRLRLRNSDPYQHKQVTKDIRQLSLFAEMEGA